MFLGEVLFKMLFFRIDFGILSPSRGTDLQILCPSTKASLLPPLMQELRLTSDGSELLGIYWSGAASGNLFLGPAAVETPYYEGENGPQTAYLLDASPGASGWYNVKLGKF